MSDPQERARALTAVACHIATHDAVDAERIVAIIDSDQRARARDAVALAVLTADPHAAARLLSSADFERYDTPVQLRICRVLATVATDLVERIARRMSGSFDRAEALLTIGTIVAREIRSVVPGWWRTPYGRRRPAPEASRRQVGWLVSPRPWHRTTGGRPQCCSRRPNGWPARAR